MKLLLVILDLTPYGGQRVAIDLAQELSYEHDVTMATMSGPIGVIPEGVRHVRLRDPRVKPIGYLRVARQLGRLIDSSDIQGVIAIMTTANLLALMGSKLCKRRPPVVVSEHSLTSVSLPASEHHPRLMLSLMRRLYPRAAAVVGVSRSTSEDLARFVNRPMLQATIYNPIKVDEIRAKALSGLPAHPWLVASEPHNSALVAVGNLKRAKGYDVLLHAMALLPPDVRLVILGDGRLHTDLKRLSLELNLDKRIAFAGYVENPYPSIAAARLLVLSSRWEGFGLVILEAAALGVKSVTTDVGGLPEVTRMAGGALVPSEDPTSLADAITVALADARGPACQWRQITTPRAVATAYLNLLDGSSSQGAGS